MKKILICALFIIIDGCSLDSENNQLNSDKIKLPNDIRWVTNSSEYQILCEQTYKNAWKSKDFSKLIIKFRKQYPDKFSKIYNDI